MLQQGPFQRLKSQHTDRALSRQYANAFMLSIMFSFRMFKDTGGNLNNMSRMAEAVETAEIPEHTWMTSRGVRAVLGKEGIALPNVFTLETQLHTKQYFAFVKSLYAFMGNYILSLGFLTLIDLHRDPPSSILWAQLLTGTAVVGLRLSKFRPFVIKNSSSSRS